MTERCTQFIKDKHSFGDRKVYSIYNSLNEISPIELRDYAEYGSLSQRNRAKDAYDRALEKGASIETKRKPGRPKFTSNEKLLPPESPRTS